MSKQDRQGVRTPAELERKYRFGKNIGAAKKAAADASRAAERAEAAAGNSLGRDEFNQIVAMLNQASNLITRLVVQSGGLSIDRAGNMVVPSIVLGGKDLESRLAAIEEKLGIDSGGSGGETPGGNIYDGGTYTVGDTWQFISASMTSEMVITDVSEHLESYTDEDGNVRLRALSAGEATVTALVNGTTTAIYEYTIVDE